MPKYCVRLIQLVPDEELDYDDRQDLGEHGENGVALEWTCEAAGVDEALDEFHSTIPIGMVDNYDWLCELVDDDAEVSGVPEQFEDLQRAMKLGPGR